MAELKQAAMQAVQDLQDADDDELYRELGLRVSAIERDPTIAGQFAPPRSMLEPKGMALGDMIAAGRRAFGSISKAGYALLCSGMTGGHFDAFIATLGTNRMAITAGLATLLVAQVGIAPAIAGVVATLVIGKVAPSSVEAVCMGWAKKAGYAAPAAQPQPA
jgi:hypothetical protein